MISLQQQLDATGSLHLIPVRRQVNTAITPTVPLFISQGMRITGDGPDSCLSLMNSSYGIIVGLRRGLISDAHWVPGGFRTLGDSFLFSRGTNWDLGPTGGWSIVRRLRVRFRGTNHTPPWHGALCGIQAPEMGYDRNPSPWQFAFVSGRLELSVKTTDHQVRTWRASLNPATPDLDVAADVDLATGAVSLTSGGTPLTVDATKAGTGFNPTLGLVENCVTPFGILRLPPYGNDNGSLWAEGAYPDTTVNLVEVHANGILLGTTQFNLPRLATYPGGPGLPLVAAWAGSPVPLLVIHQSCGLDDSARGVVLRDFKVEARPRMPAILMGPSIGGGAVVDGVEVIGGSRAVQSIGFGVHYPMTIKGGDLTHQSDCAMWLHRVVGLLLDRPGFGYPKRTLVDFCGCDGEVRGPLILGMGSNSFTSVFTQRGGVMEYATINADNEFGSGPEAFLVLHPTSFDLDKFPTAATLSGCHGTQAPLVSVRPRAPKYPGPVRVSAQMAPGSWDERDSQIIMAPGVAAEVSGLVEMT